MSPKFHDYHINLIPFGNYLSNEKLRSIDNIIDMIHYAMDHLQDEALVLSSLINHDSCFTTLSFELDRFLEIPIYIGTYSGHEAVVNQAFLDITKIDLKESFSSISEHWFKVKLLKSNTSLYKSAWSLQSVKTRQLYADIACKFLLEIGCTGFDTIDGWGFDPVVDWEIIYNCSCKYPLNIRLLAHGMNENNCTALNKYKKVSYGSCEYWVDGSIGAETAALSEPYKSGANPKPAMGQEAVYSALETSFNIGLVPCFHIIGDAALDVVIECLNNLELKEQKIRLCHLCVVREEQIQELEKYNKNLELVINPGFYAFWDSHVKKVSITTYPNLMPYQTLIRKFENVFYGSDGPVTIPDIQKAIEYLNFYQPKELNESTNFSCIFRSPSEKQK